MTRISFLMPTFNRAHFIEESIRSITSQMAPEDELIVINDGSSDDTIAVLETSEERFTLVNQENSGKSTALNRAMSEASGEFVWVCDDDDLLCAGAVDTLISLLDDPDAGWAFGRYTRFSEESGERIDLGPAHWPDLTQGSVLRHTLEDAFMMQNGSLVRRELYDRVGPFDITMLRSLDYEMFVRLALAAPAAHTDKILFEQRKHTGARGPASMLHDVGQSESVWKEWDRRIFERLGSDLSAERLADLFESPDASATKRAGILQRATIMARHDLWAWVVKDWHAAAALEGGSLHPLERDICRRAMAGRHGFVGALSDDCIAGLRALRGTGKAGQEIVEALMDGLIWRLRDEDSANQSQARELISRIEGPLGLARVLARRAAAKLRGVDEALDLTEKTQPFS